MKKYVRPVLAVVAMVCSFVAATMASSACLLFYYQPEEPKSLQD
ncbi:MAG TPA: cyclic lactone autoinducer peptide [Candidatus Avimonas sp.]|jgi:cyclic lactone autoinducer peptide|nr:cyclic lactone autoinducer peptide [Clostridiales bacterium]HOB36276.1 cyclic lactone autoinducer peptide [Candidatus Avimonas sp.]HQA16344.1 cyclic lactone autoinducer peptide [Candidatus Avimonas sp.]HQD37815.1 cyclic lactone autoinducer peptide [Candidatus Avimonas sp.]